MPIISKDDAQDKASRRVDRSLKKKTKQKPLLEENWNELTQRGASLAEQFEWLKFKQKQKDKHVPNINE
jgi:predicted nuclease with RNAse H fold